MHVWGIEPGHASFFEKDAPIMPQLTELKLRAIKATGEVKRYHDSKGLYLEVSKAGNKLWRWKYSFGGKEKRLSLGTWAENLSQRRK
jgi:hypothetical protein